MTFKEYLKSLLHYRLHRPKLSYFTKSMGTLIGASVMGGFALHRGLAIYFNDKIVANVESLAQVIPFAIGAVWLGLYSYFCSNKWEED